MDAPAAGRVTPTQSSSTGTGWKPEQRTTTAVTATNGGSVGGQRLRAASFVHHVVWDFVGNVYAPAALIGDVDNDGNNEFAVGNIKGTLAIYKGLASTRPWKICHNLGTITCMLIGDVLNVGQNMLICISGEGSLQVFDISPEPDAWTAEESVVLSGPTVRHPVHVNICRAAVADVDGDGKMELVVARTDRVLCIYRFGKQGAEVLGTPLMKVDAEVRVPERVTFIDVAEFQLPGQCGSMMTNHDAQGRPRLVIAQPGASYVTLDTSSTLHGDPTVIPQAAGTFRGGASTELVCFSGRPRRKLSGLSASGTSGVDEEAGESESYTALVAVDGTIKLLDNEFVKVWELQLGHQLFALSHADMNGDGLEEIVACSWDGLTFITDTTPNAVTFQFTDAVCAFCAGQFACTNGENLPCLFYVDYEDRITVFYHLQLTSIPMTFFKEAMSALITAEFEDILEQRGEYVALRIGSGRSRWMPLASLLRVLLYDDAAVASLRRLRDGLAATNDSH